MLVMALGPSSGILHVCRIKLEGHKPVHGIYSKDGKVGVAVVDISYGHDPNSALVVFNTEPPYSHVGPQLMIKLPQIEQCVALTTNIDQTLYIVGEWCRATQFGCWSGACWAEQGRRAQHA